MVCMNLTYLPVPLHLQQLLVFHDGPETERKALSVMHNNTNTIMRLNRIKRTLRLLSFKEQIQLQLIRLPPLSNVRCGSGGSDG